MDPSEYDTLAATEETHWWYTGMAELSGALISRSVRPPVPVLDAGSGTGGALRWLEEFGPGFGCDLSPVALEHAKRKTRAALAQADIQHLPFASDSFGLLTSFDVVYHLHVAEDDLALSEFYRVLRPGGWLCLRVPAHDWLRRAHDRKVHTRHRYGRDELKDKLARAGFEVHRVSPAGWLLFLAALVKSVTDRSAPGDRDERSELVLPGPAANRVLRRLLAAEAPLVTRGWLPFGLSLYALARKPQTASTGREMNPHHPTP